MASTHGGAFGTDVPTISDTGPYAIDEHVPPIVAAPSDVDELGRVLKGVSRAGAAVSIWGGGTKAATGNVLERLEGVVAMSGMDKIVAHNPADLTATVEAGVTMARLQQALGQHGQFLAIDSPVPERSTVGGTLARGVAGPLTWQSWSPRDLVIGMTVVLPNGKTSKSGGQVVKNVSGYDMAKLHVGGMGTLGVIAEVSFKLTPLPRSQKTVVAEFSSLTECFAAASDMMSAPFIPLAVTVVDRLAAGRLAGQNEAAPFLAIRLGGRPRTLERQVRETRAAVENRKPTELDVLSEAEAADLWRTTADFGWDDSRPLLGLRASVPPTAGSSLAAVFGEMALTDGKRPAIVSHPTYGTVLGNWYSDGDHATPTLVELARTARVATEKAGGTLVIEQCPVDVKSTLDVWGSVGESLEVMRRLKEQYDPGRALNPGRFVGGI